MNAADHIIASYYLETPMDPVKAANMIAAEQSIGTWAKLGLETDELRLKHGAKVLEIKPLGKVAAPNLPTRINLNAFGSGINAVELRIAFPHINFGPKLANLLSAVLGELTEIGAFTAIKLTGLEFPESYLKEFTGPKYGIKGTRGIINVYERPLVGAIVKPCVGLPNETIAELAYQGAKGGLDFIKDDELLGDTVFSPLKGRVKAVMAALSRAEDETGQRTMFAFNITDRYDRMRELHDAVVEGGGRAVMINAVATGLEALRELAEYSQVPIHCHRAMFPVMCRSPHIGMSVPTLTRLFRLAGADQVHCGAIAGKLYETDGEVLENIRACGTDFGPIGASMPVSSGGQWAGTVPINKRVIGHCDFIHLCGGGIYGHPGGAQAGARSVRDAWDATLQGIPLEEYAKDHPALKAAMKHFGKAVY